ncbi:MAG: PilZ domain-containing protein [Brevundimonas sp.]|uniref:PilZ domain-containing protein n=1 Tax=Brevundimonas sp. TaxID=1871086 RepID=UPI00248A2BEE|nr:PilZ domain-containing protein [Brevundimonas sp.]MDI1327957.1 PilZ domain-containing protein [Brevundimonas sp.]
MTHQPPDRRFEPRRPANSRGVIVAAGLELPCLIVDQSSAGLRVRLDRSFALTGSVIVIDLARGVAIECLVAWSKGLEAGMKQSGQTSLRGLVPSRLAAARDAFRRAGG